MKWLDAAERVLTDEGTAMHYEEIANRILSQNLVTTKTQTPGITLHASISQDIRRRQSSGLELRFAREEVGLFTMAQWQAGPPEDVRKAISRSRDHARRQLLKGLRELSGEEFESFLEVLLTAHGYDVTVTAGGDDEGIDLIAERSGRGVAIERVGIQAKRLKTNRKVGPKIIRYLRDAASSKGCTSAALITTSGFDAKALEIANEENRLPVQLLGGDDLALLAVEAGVGIRTEALTLVVEDLASTFEISEDSGS